MQSLINDPQSTASLIHSVQQKRTERITLKINDDVVEFSLRELRSFAAATQHLPDFTPVSYIDGYDRHGVTGLEVEVSQVEDISNTEPDEPDAPSRIDVVENLARQIVADHLAARFEESAAWTRPGMNDIPQADADAIVARANTLMAAVAAAFANTEAQR
jgi:hypothetical protein